MLAGLRSRWIDAVPMGRVERGGDFDGVLERLIDGKRAFRQSIGERVALEVRHDEEVGALVLADVIERADVRVIEGADRLGFAFEAFAAIGIGRGCLDRILMATVRFSLLSLARYTSPMPPAPSGDSTSYGPRRAPAAKDMERRDYSRSTTCRAPAQQTPS